MATIAKGVNLMILDLFYCSKKIKTQKISIDLRPELTRNRGSAHLLGTGRSA